MKIKWINLVLIAVFMISCNVSKKMTKQTESREENTTYNNVNLKHYLDSLFRQHVKISISHTKETFFPEGRPSYLPDSAVKPANKPSAPSPAIREQLDIGIEIDSESHVVKGDSVSHQSGTTNKKETSDGINRSKDRTVSWKFFIWISLMLIAVAGTLYCIKKKINPFVKILKIISSWL